MCSNKSLLLKVSLFYFQASLAGPSEYEELQAFTYAHADSRFSNQLRRISRDIFDHLWQHIGKLLNMLKCYLQYRQTSNIRRTFVGKIIVDNSDVVGASPVGAAPTTSSLSP